MIWGLLVSALGLAALSLSSPLPPRDGQGGMGAVPGEIVVVGDEGAPDGTDATDSALASADADAAEAEAETGTDVDPASGADAVAEIESPEAEPATPEPADTEAAAAPATAVPLPPGSEFNRPPPETTATLPAPDEAPLAAAPQAPQGVSESRSPRFDTTPSAQPDVATNAPVAIVVFDGVASDTPARPADAPAPVIASGPAALTQPAAADTPRIRTALLPQITPPEAAEEADADADAARAPEADPEPMPVPLQIPTFPTISAAPSDPASPEEAVETPSEAPADPAAEAATADAEPDAASAPAPDATSRFPQITPPVAEESAADLIGAMPGLPDDAGPADVVAPARPQGALPAIRAFAAPFDTTETRPLLSVLLIDDPDSLIEQSTLTRFTFPVTFAVDPQHPDAAARAAIYRDAGFEVVILASMIPEGATATDVEVALLAAEAILPEAVAVLDTPEGRVQGDRPVLDALVAALQASGHGLVAFPRGLNAAEQSADRVGVPAVTVFRLLDDEDQRATEITRFLARAAFTAGQEGTVVVVGRTRPDTVTALFSWALGERSSAVSLAPLSAVLVRSAGQ